MHRKELREFVRPELTEIETPSYSFYEQVGREHGDSVALREAADDVDRLRAVLLKQMKSATPSREPTPAMIQAARRYVEDAGALYDHGIAEIWRAMFDAADRTNDGTG